jgi:hypothetical protein
VAVVGDHARCLRETIDRGPVSMEIVVDHLDAIASRMRHEHAPRRRLEGAMVEVAAVCVRELDEADFIERHGHLLFGTGS